MTDSMTTRSMKRKQTSSSREELSTKKRCTIPSDSTTHVKAESRKIPTSTLEDRSSNTARVYLYEPLDTTDTKGVATRLIRIFSELSTTGQIQCELLPVDLDIIPRLTGLLEDGRELTPRIWDDYVATWTHTRYRALSYLWGPEDNDQIILINGKQHQVRRNSVGFLATSSAAF